MSRLLFIHSCCMLMYIFTLRSLFHASDDEEFEGFAGNLHDMDEYAYFLDCGSMNC